MIKAMAQHIKALVLLLALVSVPIGTGVSMELHGLMDDHVAGASVGEGSSDVLCCSIELSNSVCNALCAIVDDQMTVIVQSWASSQKSMSSLALQPIDEPDPSRRPPRSHSFRGGTPLLA